MKNKILKVLILLALAFAVLVIVQSGTSVQAQSPALDISISFSPSAILPGGVSELTIVLTNNTGHDLGIVTLAPRGFPLPLKLQVAAPAASVACNGDVGLPEVYAPEGALEIDFSVGGMKVLSSCTFKISVTGSAPGDYTATIPADAIEVLSHPYIGSTAASASLTVLKPVTVKKSFLPNLIGGGFASELTITLSNPNPVELTGVELSDILPARLTTLARWLRAQNCGSPSLTTPNSNTIRMTGGTIPAASGESAPGVCVIISDYVITRTDEDSVLSNEIPAGASQRLRASATRSPLPRI